MVSAPACFLMRSIFLPVAARASGHGSHGDWDRDLFRPKEMKTVPLTIALNNLAKYFLKPCLNTGKSFSAILTGLFLLTWGIRGPLGKIPPDREQIFR